VPPTSKRRVALAVCLGLICIALVLGGWRVLGTRGDDTTPRVAESGVTRPDHLRTDTGHRAHGSSDNVPQQQNTTDAEHSVGRERRNTTVIDGRQHVNVTVEHQTEQDVKLINTKPVDPEDAFYMTYMYTCT